MKILLALLALAALQVTAADTKSLYDIPLKDIDGKPTSLAAYKGKVVLLVNVASKCGNTPQYKGLEASYQKFKDQGFVIIGVPSNDFGAQEPGSAEEIKSFCEKNYGVSFPLMEKVSVKGPQQHPLYSQLTGKGATFPGDVSWNFGKFLIGRDGKVVSRFDPRVQPESPEVTKAVQAALAAK